MEKSFSYQQANIFYRDEGNGEPVILLHGFGEDSHIWDEQITFLKTHCRLIVPDIPGSGKSSLLKNIVTGKTTGISISDYADCVLALLQEEKITRCTMLGHSMGGYITLAFAEKYARLLNAFGLVHSTAFADSEEKKKNRERGIALIEEYGPYSFLRNTIPNLFGKDFKETHPQKLAQLIEASNSFSKESLQQYYYAMMQRPDRTAVLKSNPLPVLFVMGTEDVAAPMEDVLQQTALPLNAHIHTLQHCGHMGMWEAVSEMNNILLAFINRS